MAQFNEQTVAAALQALLNGGTQGMNENATIKYEGSALILPVGMTEAQGIEVLKRRMQEMNEEVEVHEMIPGYPLDALLALQRAMKAKYGWTSLDPTPGFFGNRPPKMVGVTIDAEGHTASVPWGRMSIPGVTGWIAPSISFDAKNQPQLELVGVVQRRSQPAVADLADAARKEVKKGSIYKGKAIRIAFPKFDDPSEFNPQIHVPAFLRLNGVTRADLIFTEAVEWAVQTSIFNPIEDIVGLRRMGTPFRSGVLVSGDYGVGKTLLANVTAKLCEENGITFIYLADTGDIALARQFAAMYAPAVIFAEDVDAILAGEERDEEVNNILNTIDGVEGKHDEVMVIFSTNHPERINRALLRPGRMDAVITIDPPDAAAAERLVRLYARDTLSKDASLTEVGKLLAGNIPAAIREVVERAKKAALPKSKGKKVVIDTHDLNLAARSMQGHLAMLKEKPVAPKSDVEKFGTAVGEALAAAGLVNEGAQA